MHHSEDDGDGKSALLPTEQLDAFYGHLRMAGVHADEIRRFGRYPHRNAVLGRENTGGCFSFIYSFRAYLIRIIVVLILFLTLLYQSGGISVGNQGIKGM